MLTTTAVKAHDFGFGPEFAIVLPAFGNLPSDLGNQLGFGERQGADSQSLGIQGRAVLQWQLDKAANVVPAQIIFSFEHAQRTAIVTAANVPVAFKSAFPSGAEVSSDSNGFSAEFQLPTHFVTVVGKYYAGSDLRFFLAGQLLSNFNDTAGLSSTASAISIDGSSTVVFGLLNGVPVLPHNDRCVDREVLFRLAFHYHESSMLIRKDATPVGQRTSITATTR